jgi:hypothetical protein
MLKVLFVNLDKNSISAMANAGACSVFVSFNRRGSGFDEYMNDYVYDWLNDLRLKKKLKPKEKIDELTLLFIMEAYINDTAFKDGTFTGSFTDTLPREVVYCHIRDNIKLFLA